MKVAVVFLLAIWKFLFVSFLLLMALAFAMTFVGMVFAMLASIGDVSSWMLAIRRDLTHHHYSFLRNWTLWTACEWRLLVWILIPIGLVRFAMPRLPFNWINE